MADLAPLPGADDAAELERQRNRVRRANIVKANKKRVAIAEFKTRMRAGDLQRWCDVIRGDEPSEEGFVKSLRVRQLLMAVPGIGEVTMFEILAVFVCSPNTQVGKLSYQRRERLANIVQAELDIGAA